MLAHSHANTHATKSSTAIHSLPQPLSSGGNSKTLMLVNLNPADKSFHETLRAARFASRVSSCDIGVAKRSMRANAV